MDKFSRTELNTVESGYKAQRLARVKGNRLGLTDPCTRVTGWKTRLTDRDV